MGAVAISWNFARQQDAAFIAKSQQLVNTALKGRIRALSNTTLDYAIWNDAYANISVAWNEEWIKGAFYSLAADGMIIFTEDGATPYTWFSEDAPAAVRSSAAALVRGVAARAALQRAENVGATPESAITTFAAADDALVVVAAAAIRRDTPDDAEAPVREREYFVASVDAINAVELEEMAALVGVHDLSFRAGAPVADASSAALHLTQATGGDVGSLFWRNEHPGSAGFLDQVWLSLLYLALLGMAAMFTAMALVKNLVRAITRADAERDANRSKSEVIALLGHELRAPLTAIASNASHMQKQLGGDSAAADAARIGSAARWMLNLINKLVDESQLDAGHLQPAPERVSVQRILDSLGEVVSRPAKARGVTVQTFADADVDDVYADRLRLTQALVNVVWACARLAGASRIDVQASRRGLQDGNHIAFTVVAHGAALKPAAGEALLNDASSPAQRSSSLKFTRKLARAMGGDLVVDPTQRDGVCFTLLAPEAQRLCDVA